MSISRIIDKSNSRCLEQKNQSHPYQFTQNDYSISRTLDVLNKFVGPLTVQDICNCTTKSKIGLKNRYSSDIGRSCNKLREIHQVFNDDKL